MQGGLNGLQALVSNRAGSINIGALGENLKLGLKKIFLSNFFGEITLYPPEVSTYFHFCLQSLKCDTLPPQTFKLWQFNPFVLFIPKMPLAHLKK
jgi:hypothetical protein